jgi:hypothetical protein
MVFNDAVRRALRAAPSDAELVSHDWWTYQVTTGIGGVARYDPKPSVKYRQHRRNLVGANIGWRARSVRLTAFARGRVAAWNDVNLKLLDAMRGLLTTESVLTLDRYTSARQKILPARLWLIWKSGVYRQSFVETIGLFVGAVFGKL